MGIPTTTRATPSCGLKIMRPFMKTTLKNNNTATEAYGYLRFCGIRSALVISIINLLLLTHDRVVAVTKPFIYNHRSIKSMILSCLCVWLFAILSVSLLYGLTKSHINNNSDYVNLSFPLTVFPSTIAFIVCYAVIFKILRNRRHTVSFVPR